MSDKWSTAKKEIMKRRRLRLGSTTGGMASTASRMSFDQPLQGVAIIKADQKKDSLTKKRMATVMSYSDRHSPTWRIAHSIQNALDPTRAPGKVKTLADMTPGEITAIERQYGFPIKKKRGT